MDSPDQNAENLSPSSSGQSSPSIGAVWLSLLITPALSLLTVMAHSDILGLLTFLSSPITAIIAGIIIVKRIHPKRPTLFGFVIIVLIMVANASVSLAGCAALNANRR